MFLDITGVLQAFLCSKSRRKAKCEKGGRSRCQVVGMYSYIWKRNSSSAFSAKHAKCFQTYFTYLYYSNFLHLMFKHPEILFFQWKKCKISDTLWIYWKQGLPFMWVNPIYDNRCICLFVSYCPHIYISEGNCCLVNCPTKKIEKSWSKSSWLENGFKNHGH